MASETMQKCKKRFVAPNVFWVFKLLIREGANAVEKFTKFTRATIKIKHPINSKTFVIALFPLASRTCRTSAK